MNDIPGAIPTIKDRSRAAARDNLLHPFDRTDAVLEKRGAPPRFSAVAWPFLAGLALALIAPKLMDVLDGLNPWIERAVFPYVLLARRPEFGLNWELSGHLPRAILLIQFPLEGLLTMRNLRRRFPMWVAVGQLIVIHLVGMFVLFLLLASHGQ
ncbi:MAG TPA: hypothetical protein VGG26_05065 [Terracidiphilus sp.]|jgi:hypothetical protein